MPWTTLTLEVTTPLFNSGADAKSSDGTGVRVSSLRGAMRWWFRALAGTVIGPDDLDVLWRVERAVFGGRGGEGEDTSSSFRMRIPRQPLLIRESDRHVFLSQSSTEMRSPRARAEQPGYWVVYLLGQGLGNLGKLTLCRPYVAPGETFDLKFRFDGDDRCAALALAALWLTCTYGGVGARTRRGFGGLRIIDSTGWLPEPWTPDSIRTPGLEYYTGLRNLHPSKGPVFACMPHLESLIVQKGGTPARDAWHDRPPFPVMGEKCTIAGLSGGRSFGTWDFLLNKVGEEFRCFRAREEHPEVKRRYWPPRKTREWRTVVHGDSKHFPLGALGLPVVYKGDCRVNVWCGDEEHRRASPLWLRPVGSPGNFRLFSFAFLGDFIPGEGAPDGPCVQLRGKGRDSRTLKVTRDDVKKLAEEWIKRLAELK